MNNWAAPLLVFTLGTIGSIAVGEPFAFILTVVISSLGYSINKAAK